MQSTRATRVAFAVSLAVNVFGCAEVVVDASDAPSPTVDASQDAAALETDGGNAAGGGGPRAADGSILELPSIKPLDPHSLDAVDVLFVIDNSGSMASEQVKLAKELPRLVEVLTTGDRCAGGNEGVCKLNDQSEPKRHFTAVKQLHLGVVSSNMGGVDAPAGTQPAVLSCKGLGDDGKLLTSVQVAVDGVIAGRQEFQGYAQGETVVAPNPSCDIGLQPNYQEYVAGGKETAGEQSRKFACVANLGVRGCPFEQQLEAMWKALAPSEGVDSSDNYKFLNTTKGQGDTANKGFLRSEAILAVIAVSDEEDCSITDEGKVLFSLASEASAAYGPLNLRCGLASQRADVDRLIRPSKRYISGLKSLKPNHEERIVYTAIVGVPQSSAAKTPTEILGMPEMQFAENPTIPGVPNTSCTGMTGTRADEAFPPRRFMEVAAGFGENAVWYSICEASFAPAFDTLIGKIASKLR